MYSDTLWYAVLQAELTCELFTLTVQLHRNDYEDWVGQHMVGDPPHR